jgi:hypothetical protein
VGHANVIVDAIEADFQICPALMTALGPSRLTGQRVFPTTLMAMAIQHGPDLNAMPRGFQID